MSAIIFLYTISILLVILAVTLFWWSLFRDRARDRLRCPKCWYDLTSSCTLLCSECGYQANTRSDLHKTKRNRLLACVSLLIMAAAVGLGSWPRLAHGQWLAFIPDSILVRIAPLGDSQWIRTYWDIAPSTYEPNHVLNRELRDRIMYDDLDLEDWKTLLNRVVSNSWAADRAFVHTYDSWPRDIPLSFIWNPEQFNKFMHLDIKLQLVPNFSNAMTYDVSVMIREGFRIDSIPSDADEIDIALRIKLQGQILVDKVVRTISIVESANGILAGDESEEMNALVRRHVLPVIIPSVGMPVDVVLPDVSQDAFGAMTVGVVVEIASDEIVVATGFRRYLVNNETVYREEYDRSRIRLSWDMDALNKACDMNITDWRLHLRGDPAIALHDLPCESYWAGEIEFQLDQKPFASYCQRAVVDQQN